MQIPLKQLEQQLKKQLATLYLIATDETFLAQQARDTIYTAAKQQGFNEKKLIHFDKNISWNDIFSSLQNLSLFSEKTVTDVRDSNIKLNTSDLSLLEAYFNHADENNLMIITTDKLSKPQQSSKWFKLIEKHGAVIQIFPITLQHLPAWINMRLEKSGLTADTDAVKLLATLTEGNLLATHQAIEKCRMLKLTHTITASDIAEIVNDNARFNIFDLTNYMLQGNTQHVIRIIEGLRQTGTEPTLVLWVIARELRTLIDFADRIQQGSPLQEVIRHEWQSRKPLLQSALKRLSLETLLSLLKQAMDTDKMIKGLLPDTAWQQLTQTGLSITGAKYLS